MKYIHKFETVAEAVGSAELPLPQVVYVEEGNTNLQCAKSDGYETMKIVQEGGNLKPEPIKLYFGLKFTSTRNSTIGLANNGGNTPDMKYSLDNGQNWTTWNYSSISLTNGQTVCFKGNNPNGFSSTYSKYSQFKMTGSIKAAGNIMSLIDDGACNTIVIPRDYCFSLLFSNCTSLTSAPELPATTLADYCYYQMFYNCTALTSAPELPATTLADYCYRQMFRGCTSLTSAPVLSATTLTSNCYYYMFYGCSHLSYINCLATSGINTNNSTANWVNGVASSGTFIKDHNAAWPTGNNGIPSGWTVQDAA